MNDGNRYPPRNDASFREMLQLFVSKNSILTHPFFKKQIHLKIYQFIALSKMFSYYPRTSQPFYPIKNFYQPTQYSHPRHNTSPFYNLPESFYYPSPQRYSNCSS